VSVLPEGPFVKGPKPKRGEAKMAKIRTFIESLRGKTIPEKLACFAGYIDAETLAIILDTPADTIYKWVDAKPPTIPHVRINGCLKFDPVEIIRWLEKTSVE
jgi:hypothetical protein